MSISPLDDLQWDLIVDRIHEGRCVPFLGAGANVGSAARKYEGLLLGGDLAKRFAAKTKGNGELARLALEYQVLTDRPYLLRFLKAELKDDRVKPSPAL